MRFISFFLPKGLSKILVEVKKAFKVKICLAKKFKVIQIIQDTC